MTATQFFSPTGSAAGYSAAEATPAQLKTSRQALLLLAAMMFGLNFWGPLGFSSNKLVLEIYPALKGLFLLVSLYLILHGSPHRRVVQMLCLALPFFLWAVVSLLLHGIDTIGITTIASEDSVFVATALGMLLVPTRRTLQTVVRLSNLAILIYFLGSLVLWAAGVPITALHDPVPVLYLNPDRWSMDTLCIVSSAAILLLHPRRLSASQALTLLLLLLAVTLSAIRIYQLAILLVTLTLYVVTRGRRAWTGLILASLLVGPIAMTNFLTKSAGDLEAKNEDDMLWGVSTDGRLKNWTYLAAMTAQHPLFGNGPGFDSKLIGNPSDDYSGTEPDNDFLAVASGAGWPDAAFLALGIWVPVGIVVALRKRVPPVLPWTTGVFALAYTLVSLTDNPLRNPAACYPMFLFAGMTLRLALCQPRQGPARLPRGRYRPAAYQPLERRA